MQTRLSATSLSNVTAGTIVCAGKPCRNLPGNLLQHKGRTQCVGAPSVVRSAI